MMARIPVTSLIDVKGKLYGTTLSGGLNEYYGTIFRVTMSGKEKVLHSFPGQFGDGMNPVANLVDVRGTLYGTTQYTEGPPSYFGGGVVFSITSAGSEKILYAFFPNYGSNGAYPQAGLISVKGTLYGTTPSRGYDGGGTAYSITKNGDLTTLHSFYLPSDGSGPWAPLLKVHDKLYGTTAGGGAYGKGTVFSYEP